MTFSAGFHLPSHLQRWRALFASAAFALLLLPVVLLSGRRWQRWAKPEPAGWAGSYLFKQADSELSQLLNKASWDSPMRKCTADLPTPNLTSAAALLGTHAEVEANEELVFGIAQNLPCTQGDGGGKGQEGTMAAVAALGQDAGEAVGPAGCCSLPLSLRRGTTDYNVFNQVFQSHYLRFMYALFPKGDEPRYILDAGANVGFSTVLFRLLWPEAQIVSLEPDASNFKQLLSNTQRLKEVHALQAGLWGRRANITIVGNHGAWGRVFREATPGQPGIPAYSMQDLADLMGIPGFDFVKIDIEGAEGMVFAPGGDFAWIKKARAVLLEIHDYFAGYFGLEEVSSRVDAAFNSTGYTLVADNEHILYLDPQLRQAVAAIQLL